MPQLTLATDCQIRRQLDLTFSFTVLSLDKDI